MSTPPRRRWFRFSLRTLLALVTIIAILLAWVTNQRRRSQREELLASQLREQPFAIVKLAGPYDVWDVSTFECPTQHGWRNEARKLLGERIWRVQGARGGFTDLAPLAELTNLQWLDLDGAAVEDLTPLAGLTSLESLWLSRSQVRDLTPLSGLHRLKSLDIWGTPVSKQQIEALQRALPKCKIHHSPFADSE